MAGSPESTLGSASDLGRAVASAANRMIDDVAACAQHQAEDSLSAHDDSAFLHKAFSQYALAKSLVQTSTVIIMTALAPQVYLSDFGA